MTNDRDSMQRFQSTVGRYADSPERLSLAVLAYLGALTVESKVCKSRGGYDFDR